MKKSKYSHSDFNINKLPSTRKEQYKDILQCEYRTLISLWFLMLLFFIPEMIIYLMKDYAISSIISNLVNNQTSLDETLYSLKSAYLVYDSLELICLIIFFLGLAGVYRVFRILLWNEGLFFKDDFIEGIRLNGFRFALNAIVIELCILAIDLSDTVLYKYTKNANIFSGISIFLTLFVIIPIVLFNLAQENFYSNSCLKTIINSFKLTIGKYPKMLLFSLVFAFIFFIFGINNKLLVILIFALAIVFLLPLYLCKNITFSLGVFDELINDNFKEIKNKGLFKKN